MDIIDQQVIDDNKEIFAKIQTELIKAESEILIASAWFTDEELFNILLDKLTKGIHIEVIVADNQENERLDFGLLVAKGALVYKIKSSGYGGMNQKFCVIDKRIALHGSYNWTMNAKKNNQESIISTNHRETIDSLIDNFNVTKTRILTATADVPASKPEKTKGISIELPVKIGVEFEHLLDSMIASEVGNFDRKLLREQGYERCSANNGDHQVLHKAFDTLYSVFINDIDVIEDKKNRLITKIDEHRVKNLDHLAKNCDLQINSLEKEKELNHTGLETKRNQLEAEIEMIAKNMEEWRSVKIPFLEKQKDELDQQIKNEERELIRPKIKWFEFIPTVIFNLALLVYLFLFYSSAAYILLFSISDAKSAEAQGLPIQAIQIFNPEAVTRALHKSGTAPLFIFLFVFIPLAVAVIDRFVTSKWAIYSILAFGIIGLDVAVAYKVTQAVHEVNYASGTVNVAWTPGMAFGDPNFYLVFVFGAFGLLLFKFAFKKLMQLFEERNPDILTQRNQLSVKHLREDMAIRTAKIMNFREEIAAFEKSSIQLKADVKRVGLELTALPLTLNQELQSKRSQLNSNSKTIDQIASIYTQHIESDNLPISVDSLKDRMNVFLEGWNDALCQEYAVHKAMLKTANAAEAAMTWQNQKLQKGQIDKRVNVY